MQTGWRVGSLLGIPLYIDPSWFFIVALVTFVNAGAIQQQEIYASWGPLLPWLVGLAMALLLFGSVLLHELGHSIVARSQGIQVNSITLFLFGGVAAIAHESKTPGKAFQVAIAGPMVSFGLFGLMFLLIGVLPSQSPVQVLATCANLPTTICWKQPTLQCTLLPRMVAIVVWWPWRICGPLIGVSGLTKPCSILRVP